MATITMVASVNYSTLGAVNNDIINLNGYTLTIATQPAETGISIITPAKAGRVVIWGGYDLSTWSMTAGTTNLITTIPAGCVIGELVGGSGGVTYGCATNNGTITSCVGGSGFGSSSCQLNKGMITTCVGGSASWASGCDTNNGTITTSTGSPVTNAFGCRINNATITTCTGGSVSGAHGCYDNYATILAAFDDVERAINISYGDFKLVIGPDFQTTISNPSGDITTIYSIGELSGLATIPVGVTVITLSMGAGGGLMKIGQGGGYNG